MQLLVVVSLIAAATLPLPAASAAGCSSDLDCHLNGECSATTGACNCYPAWIGESCGLLDVQPVSKIQGYGMQPNVTSWGGNVVFAGGEYHLFVAEIVENCSLSAWYTNSQVTHAVASSPEGPYRYADTALPVWAHNPQVIAFDDGGQTAYALFHIGLANSSRPSVVNCTAGGADVSFPAFGARVAAGVPRDSGAGMDGLSKRAQRLRERRKRQQQQHGQRGVTTVGDTPFAVHVASSPYGPWSLVFTAPGGCNNPAPMLHPNGTWFLLCNSATLFSAPALAGPWAALWDVPAGGVPGAYEDAFLFIDPRGNWHVLYHVYNATTPCGDCASEVVSGHVFSRDGRAWNSATVQPFTNVVAVVGADDWALATRERPKLLFDAQTGDPTHLLNGVCGGVSSCAPTPAVNCKYDFWDFTLVQSLLPV